MRKQGFTLIELLAVIMVLGLVGLIAIPTITKMLKNYKETLYDNQVKVIKASAKKWGIENINQLSETEAVYLNLSQLIEAGYIEQPELKDPRNTKIILNGCIVITYNDSYSIYEYHYTEEDCLNLKPFTTCGDIFTDARDSNKYKTVQIGEQCWMAEDLKYRCVDFQDVGESSASWSSSESYCAPQKSGYNGILYQWKAVMNGNETEGSQGICPEGWHVPTLEEWQTLETYLGGDSVAGSKLKAKTPTWDGSAIDNSGFNAKPGGIRNDEGLLYTEIQFGGWWLSSGLDYRVWACGLVSEISEVNHSPLLQSYGNSVRCILG